MREYTTDTPVFKESIPIVEEKDLVNEENDNAAAKQLLQNILVLMNIKVNMETGKSLVSETEREVWNGIYEQATGYVDLAIANLINGAPSTLDTLGEIANAMSNNEDVVAALDAAIGTKANQAEMESLLGTKLDKTGDSKDNTITFESGDSSNPTGWVDVGLIASGEKHSSLLRKISLFAKNVRYLWKLLGTTSLAGIGDGTVTGAISSLNTGLEWKRVSGRVTGTDRLNLPDHRELYVTIDFRSQNTKRRTLMFPNTGGFHTDVLGEIDGVIDYVRIYYNQTSIEMATTSNPMGVENFQLLAWYR